MVLMIHEVMDETDELGFLVASVRKVNESSVETVIEYSFIVTVVLTCSSCDGSTGEVHHSRVDGDLEGGMYGVF
jgi:hypothetical protein